MQHDLASYRRRTGRTVAADNASAFAAWFDCNERKRGEEGGGWGGSREGGWKAEGEGESVRGEGGAGHFENVNRNVNETLTERKVSVNVK